MINTAVIIGRLTGDPELKHTQNDISVTSFTVAVDRPYVKAGEERQADFIDVVAWRGTAEFICKYFSKGQLIALQGAIQTRTYTDKDNNKRKAVELVAGQAHFVGPKKEGTSGGNAAPAKTDKGNAALQEAADFDAFSDSDLPF